MDSIIFDLDGTLWDSRETVLVAWNTVIKNRTDLHIELTAEDFKQTMGLHVNEIALKLFPTLDATERDQVIKDCCVLERDYIRKKGGKLYHGVESVLKSLSKSYQLFIVSNCQDGYIESFFEYHKLGTYFIDFENPGRTGLSKGDNIKLIIERNHLSSPVYVGDTEGDRQAAINAGIPFIYAEYGFGEAESWDERIHNINELLSLL